MFSSNNNPWHRRMIGKLLESEKYINNVRCWSNCTHVMAFTVSFFPSVPLYLRWINPKTFNQWFVQLLCFFWLLRLFPVTISAIFLFIFLNRGYFYHSNFSVGNWNSFTWVAYRQIKQTKKSKIKPFAFPLVFTSLFTPTSVLAKTLQSLEGRPNINATVLNEQQEPPVKSLHPFLLHSRTRLQWRS